MSLHYLDDSKRPKRCVPCKGRGKRRSRKERGARICIYCNGTGRLGDAGAEQVEVVEVDCGRCGARPGNSHRNRRCLTDGSLAGWYVRDDPSAFVGPLAGRREPRVIGCMGPYPTETAALEAAREAQP